MTSREVLRLSAEQLFPVPPLALPNLAQLPEQEELAQYGAVSLFLQRAQAIKLDFTLTQANGRAIAELCVRLDGLPLAIELAAARIRLLPPQALLARLAQRFQVLTGGSRTRPLRQQTMRNTIQWSYDLLTVKQRRYHSLLAHLAAYLFSDVLHSTGKRGFPAHTMGEILFGWEALQAAITRVMEPWLAMGYAEKRQERFVFTTILALLANRNPHLEALTVAILEKLRENNPSPEMQSRIGQLQRVLISLHLLPTEKWETMIPQPKLQVFQDEFVVDVHPRWVAWLRAFWHQTPISQHNRRDILRHVLIAFRWVTQHHPHVTEPGQWTRELALQYVAYVCNEATVYDYVSPTTQQRLAKQLEQRRGEPLKAATQTARNTSFNTKEERLVEAFSINRLSPCSVKPQGSLTHRGNPTGMRLVALLLIEPGLRLHTI